MVMHKLLLIGFCLGMGVLMHAQENPTFQIKLPSDSVLMGNYLQVTFQLDGAKGTDFIAPPFEGFHIVSGPNMSSSFQMINGEVSQSMSYSYYLEPKEVGNYYIEPASIRTEGGVVETEPTPILVLPNPDGIIQQPQSMQRQLEFKFDDFAMPPGFEPPVMPRDTVKKKKKRKTYKL